MADANAFAFTTERLRQLAPRADRYEVKDTHTPGLRCRVTPAGVKTLSYYRWVPASGKPERITIGKWPDTSIDTARRRCATLGASVAQGKSPANERRSLREEATLAELWAKYEAEHLPRLADKTRANVTGLWSNHVPATLKGRRLSDVSHGDVSALHARIGREHKRTANKVLGLLRAMFRAAPRWGYTGANPTGGVKQFPHGQRERFLLPNELPKFLEAVQASPEPFNRLWHLLLLTGVRLNNMLTAEWSQFDLDAGLWQVPSSAHKNRQPHALPLLPEAVALLRAQRERVPASCPWVWPAPTNPKTHLTQNGIRDAWADLCERAGTPGLWRHDLRRTVGSYMAMGGASLPMVGKALGHRSVQATQVYARLMLDPVRAAMASALAPMAAPVAAPARRTRAK